MDDMFLITEKLTKKYGDVLAVNNAELHIRRGAIYGLIGMNGAGKTTIMKILAGLATPTSGSFTYTGITDKKESNIYSRIGAFIESPAVYPGLSGYDNLRLKCLAYGISDKKYVYDKLETVGIADAAKQKTGKYSLGMKQRLGIALALVGEPDFLLLDEPINGLDPQGIFQIRDMLGRLNKEKNITILISSHILEELSKVATDYGIISAGRIVEELTREELMSKSRNHVVIKTDNPEKVVTVLDELGYKEYSVVDGETITIFDKTEEISVLNMEIAKRDIKIKSIGDVPANLEEYFLKTTAIAEAKERGGENA